MASVMTMAELMFIETELPLRYSLLPVYQGEQGREDIFFLAVCDLECCT